ncbi:sodium ion-translocating decarboxylase subunit beta [Flavilitoribacter nigricans]|uniref:Glutaconyl-CoA decarboxylase subunit beta n=1 Tax=Flavilitoribacter nigricans (strain ATCC 23147 / DSM 23189 / NBRC 102662 / NCIMB 1420 / SS-2) TaxID=1122177 RepID=A0A2D0NGW4_FLAN2|nr:sodium ion-translocating decarboxylase subunit beta [Flavilitoribacter nigricans]PHN07731.1 glutaconyl-CoA decarboxylase subunit beta [Flavilitoribacter nigricans DSM 23189 = NBRC 102662]
MNEILLKLYEMTAFGEIVRQPGSILMLILGFTLLYLGIGKKYEPLLLVPIGFGVLLANFPGGNMAVVPTTDHPEIAHMALTEIAAEFGIMNMLYYALIKTGLLPPLIFLGVGAMTDFGPMLRNLRLALFGAAAQIGIFTVLFSALFLGFNLQEAGALGIIGGADGPTAIYTAIKLAPHLLGPIAIAAYSYMALVPVIIPLVVRYTVSKKELKINMREQDREFPEKVEIKNLRAVKIIFPIVLATIVALLVPSSVPLVGLLLFGNLIKEIGQETNRLFKAASETIMNTATIFLGLTVGATMTAPTFLNGDTLKIVLAGFLAFAISILGGIVAVKIYNLFARKKINPLIGATGLSAVPMASRVANEIALKYDPRNHILQYAMSSNISGVIGSAVAAGVLISFLGGGG